VAIPFRSASMHHGYIGIYVKNNNTFKCSHSVGQNLTVHVYKLNVVLTIKFYIFLINELSVFCLESSIISLLEGFPIIIVE